jgi:hypothetical protein
MGKSFFRNFCNTGHIQARSATPPKFLLKASLGVNQPKDCQGQSKSAPDGGVKVHHSYL